MKVYNATRAQLDEALETINRERYAGNVIYNRHPEAVGRALRFTLRVKDSKAPGARRGHTGRRMVSACWHVHGHLFDALTAIAPDARISAGVQIITRDSGNWKDRNIGSILSPLYHSEACEC